MDVPVPERSAVVKEIGLFSKVYIFVHHVQVQVHIKRL